jgi:hypothetical protein
MYIMDKNIELNTTTADPPSSEMTATPTNKKSLNIDEIKYIDNSNSSTPFLPQKKSIRKKKKSVKENDTQTKHQQQQQQEEENIYSTRNTPSVRISIDKENNNNNKFEIENDLNNYYNLNNKQKNNSSSYGINPQRDSYINIASAIRGKNQFQLPTIPPIRVTIEKSNSNITLFPEDSLDPVLNFKICGQGKTNLS